MIGVLTAQQPPRSGKKGARGCGRGGGAQLFALLSPSVCAMPPMHCVPTSGSVGRYYIVQRTAVGT